MKIGVIGAGNWGKNLVKNFSDIGVLAGVADGLESNLQAAKEVCPQATLYSDHNELLADGYDAVAIATPAHTHYPIAKQAIEAGCDVFIEKPMTLDPAESEQLVALAKQHDRILMVGHLLLYQPAIGFIKNALGEGLIGKVHSLHQRRSKLGRARAVENVLWSFGVHDVAVLLHLAGETPSNIQIVGQDCLQAGIEDDVFLHLDFPSGVKAHLHNSWLWPMVERSLIIIGSEGMLVYDEIAQTVTLAKKTIDADLQNNDQGEEIVFNGSGQPLRLELTHFLDCCKDRTQPTSCGQNGLDVVRVLDQASAILNSK